MMTHRIYRFSIWACTTWFFIVLAPCIRLVAQEDNSSINDQRILLEWSAVEPRVSILAERMQDFSNLPFNATVTVFVADDGSEFVWDTWGQRQYTLADFSKVKDSLQKLATRDPKFKILTRINVPTTDFDWRDDVSWRRALANIQVHVELAKLGRFDGIVLDTEQYGVQVFSANAAHESDEVATIETVMKTRGQEFMTSIEGTLSTPILLITFAYRATLPDVGDGRDGVDYRLLEPFLDGIIENAQPKTRVIDGWEYSYGYREETRYQEAVQEFLRSISAKASRNRVQLGFGIWLDFAPNKYPWQEVNAEANYFSPVAFRDALSRAFDYGEGLVWIYTQQPNLWNQEKLPLEYLRVMRQSWASHPAGVESTTSEPEIRTVP